MRQPLTLVLVLLCSVACSQACSQTTEPQPTTEDQRGAAPAPESIVELPPLQHDLCEASGWCWVNPRPHGNSLADVAAVSSTELWAVGSGGTIMHFERGAWTSETLGTAMLERVWPRAVDDVWVLGRNGFVAHRDANNWQILPTDTDVELHDIDGIGDQAWIVGEHGVVLHWDGHQLRRDNSFPNQANHAIEVIAADDIWVGGLELHHFDGHTWTRDPTLGLGACMDIHAFTPDDVWCTDDRGRIYRWNGEHWSFAVAGEGMVPLHREADLARALASNELGRQDSRFVAFAPDDLYVTINVDMFHWDGSNWTKLWTLPQWPKWTFAATITDTREVFGVGDRGLLFHGREEPWTMIDRGTAFAIDHILADNKGGLVVAGTSWSADARLAALTDGVLVETGYSGPLDDLAGTGPNDLWLVGTLGGLQHFNGTAWTKIPTGTIAHLRGLWVGDGFGWAVGEDGTIIAYDGSSWAPVASPVKATIVGVWAAGRNDAWAVAIENEGVKVDGCVSYEDEHGLILRWDGTTWQIAERHQGTPLHVIGGVDAQHVWIGGTDRLLTWDGTAWTHAPGWSPGTERSAQVLEINALAPDDVWVAEESTIHHFDGVSWTKQHPGIAVRSMRAQPQRVWIGGNGQLLVKSR